MASSSIWEKIRELSSTSGQGNVWLVAKRGATEPTERLLQALSINVAKAISTEEERASSRKQFEIALQDFIDRKYVLGAMKQLKDPNDEAKVRLKREVEVYKTISDPHLVKLLDTNLSENWIVTEFQPNGTLQDRLPQFRGDVLSTLRALRPLVRVIGEMHSSDFTHRDLKPGNIFIGWNGQFVCGDAGLAFYSNDHGARVTRTYENVGARDYMPAWAMSRRSEISPTFDVFSVGKVVWAMIAGRPACALWYIHEDDTDLEKIFANEGSFLWANELLDKCVVEREGQMRVKNGTELLAEIDTTITAIEGRAVPPSQMHQVRRSCRVCGVGEYMRSQATIGNDVNGRRSIAYECNRCGHIELFRDLG